MKKTILKLLFAVLFTTVSAPYCIQGFDISAYSTKLMEFSGSEISGGQASTGSFVPKNNYVVVNMKNTKYDGTQDGWPTPPIWNGLKVTLRIKSGWGYSSVSSQEFGDGTHTSEYVAHKGERYDLYFSSSNYNFWNSTGAVYAYR